MTGTGIAGAADNGPAPDEPRCYVCGGQFEKKRGEWICHSARIVPGKGLKEFCSEECAKMQGKTGEPATDEEIALVLAGTADDRGVTAAMADRLIARIDKERGAREKTRTEMRELLREWGNDGKPLPAGVNLAEATRALFHEMESETIAAESEAAALRQEVERLKGHLDKASEALNAMSTEMQPLGDSRRTALTKEPTP